MPTDKNALGQRGENAVAAQLLRPIQGDAVVPDEPFLVEIFGGKHQLFDGIVYLKDRNGSLSGAHFFIQIKTRIPKGTKSYCSARYERAEVAAAISFRVPVYLVGVEARSTETCFVRGISHSRKSGIARITKSQRNLSSPGVKKRIYEEVLAFHGTLPSTFESNL